MKTIKLIVSAGLLFGSFSLFATDVRRTSTVLIPFGSFDTVKAITFTGTGDQTSAISMYNKNKAEQDGVVWVSGQVYYRAYNSNKKSPIGSTAMGSTCPTTQPLFGGIKGSLVNAATDNPGVTAGTTGYCMTPISSTATEKNTASTLADLKFKLGL
ncbi:MAG TPA: hypothetical protein VGT41_01850 [Candidatus Babeliales bacterium]|nr:hypothetical protein [Candidatus Babeliales bacterium]